MRIGIGMILAGLTFILVSGGFGSFYEDENNGANARGIPEKLIPDEQGRTPDHGNHFTENLGQWNEEILFVGETSFGRIGLAVDMVYLDIQNRVGQVFLAAADPYRVSSFGPSVDEGCREGHVLRYRFGNDHHLVPKGVDPLPHTTNYFLGNDPDRWVTHAASYREVVYENVWEGIDIKYHFAGDDLKYDIILQPGASPRDIRIGIEGHEGLGIDEGGFLRIDIDGGMAMDRDLDVFYMDDPDDKVRSSFHLISHDEYGFDIVDLQHDRVLVIDPLITSTYFGTSEREWGMAVEIDNKGDVILGGSTNSEEFSTTTGAYQTSYGGSYGDYFVSKFNDDCSSLIFSTYIGGSGMEGYGLYSCYLDIVEDGILMTGATGSDDFPTTEGCFQSSIKGQRDGFFLKLSLDGTSLSFSSYLGGSSQYDTPDGIAESSDGGFFVYGLTGSDDFPTTEGVIMESPLGGYYTGFISKFNGAGNTLTFSTYIGGSGWYDYVRDLAEDENGEIIITGYTYSSDFPTTEGAYNRTMEGYYSCYVSRLKDDASDVIASTFLGGGSYDQSVTMVLKDGGNIVIAGETRSGDFPVTENAFGKEFAGSAMGFVAELKSDLSDIVASTFIGGSSTDTVKRLNLDSFGNLIVSGETSSSDLNTTHDAYQIIYNGGKDFFISIMSGDLDQQTYCTYVGGSGNDTMEDSAMDPLGTILFTGTTTSTDFPVLTDAYQKNLSGTNNAVIIALSINPWLEPLAVQEVRAYSDPAYSIPVDRLDRGDRVFVELSGIDANTSLRSGARVNITYQSGDFPIKHITLLETGNDTGVHRGVFQIPIKASYLDVIDIVSWKDPSRISSITVDKPFRPTDVSSLTLFSDGDYSTEFDKFDLGDKVFIRIVGTDASPISADHAFAMVTSDRNLTWKELLILNETGTNSGDYRGTFTIPQRMSYFENLTITSVRNPGVSDELMVHDPQQIRPLEDETTAVEDEEYRVRYWNFGYNPASWTMNTDALWLYWDNDLTELYGTPNNNHVGLWNVWLNISDGKGNSDHHDFQIEVLNTPPNITTEPVTEAWEDKEYYVDFNCTDDGQGEMTWTFIGPREWLTIKQGTGELSGTPRQQHIGNHNVSVIVTDDHGGDNSLDFQITVFDVNKRPIIQTIDKTTGIEGERYYNRYEAIDPDGDEALIWELYTDAGFLTMENETGILSGTPGPLDVGQFNVNVTVKDSLGAFDSHLFLLTVEDVNSRPVWVDVPEDTSIDHGDIYSFYVEADDYDSGDVIEFSVTTTPSSDLEIDARSGEIEWTASAVGLEDNDMVLEVTIKASDGEFFIVHDFQIEVIPTLSPSVTMTGPAEGERTPSTGTTLSWSGSDPENDHIVYDVYVHDSKSFVQSKREEAMYSEHLDAETITVTELEWGRVYYWTVIPFDHCTFGICEDGIMTFKVNNPPIISKIPDQEVETGREFTYKVRVADEDQEDMTHLMYSIEDAPDGVTISKDDGKIIWKPRDNQAGNHMITISVYDGIEKTTDDFSIRVIEGEDEGGTSMLLTIGVAIMIVLFIVIILLQIIILKKKGRVVERSEEDKRDVTKKIKETVKKAADDMEKIEDTPEEGLSEEEISPENPVEEKNRDDRHRNGDRTVDETKDIPEEPAEDTSIEPVQGDTEHARGDDPSGPDPV
ncbi:MAG: putative Ig domain-containing protein [Thermoplasmatota archaeon]